MHTKHAFLVASALLAAVPASAATFALDAIRVSGPAIFNPAGYCAPGLTLDILPGPPVNNRGTSNLGDFSATILECPLGPPPAPNAGSFWEFSFEDGSTLFGSKSGNPTGGDDAGFTFISNMVIEGGSGRFLRASGTLAGVGSVVFARDPIAIETITGTFEAPEPGAMALLGVVLGGLWAARRRLGK